LLAVGLGVCCPSTILGFSLLAGSIHSTTAADPPATKSHRKLPAFTTSAMFGLGAGAGAGFLCASLVK